MCLAGHDEHGRFRVVAFEALTEVRLVQLHARPGLGTQDGSVSADALDDPLAHEERGLQAYSATLGALAQAQAIHEAFEEPHPYARFELAHAHHPVRANAERPVAVHALPTLGAVTSTPFADDADAAAAHARLHLVRVARRRVQREPLVQGVAQRLDGKVALLRRQFAQFLPDPIGYTRHLARSHTTIVATQQLQYKSKSQPWSNRANDFTKQAGKIAGNIGDTAGKITKDVAKGAGKLAGDAGKMTAAVAGSVAQSAAVASGEVSKAADSMAKGTVSIAKNVKDSADKVDLFNSKLRAKAVEDYNNAVERYENVADDLAKSTQALYDLRKIAIVHVKYVEQHINQLANTPKEFAVELHKINTEVTTFENKEDEIKEAEKQAKAAEGGSGAGATLSALGIAVATMGPTAAMGVATTFGVASTGTAISALSGAAANSAALAWLGGGALAAGGGGMSAGTAFLGLAGPVGWTIAGVAGAAAIGSGIYANHKNKETADKLLLERQNVEVLIRKFNVKNAEVAALTEATQTQIDGVQRANAAVTGADYSQFSHEEKMQAGLLVNMTLTLAQMINKELELDD